MFILRQLAAIVFFTFAFVTPAHAGDQDRFSAVHVHKKCGPIPWEAFSANNYNQGEHNETDVGVKGEGDAKTQTGGGEIKVGTSHEMSVGGQNYELPMTGGQWLSMYIVYMNCVVRLDGNPVDAQAIWHDISKGGIVKTVQEAQDFMKSAAALNDPAGDEWWSQIKQLIDSSNDEELKKMAADIAEDRKKIDDLYAETAALRTRVGQLEIAVKTLQDQVDLLLKILNESDPILAKEIKRLSGQTETLTGLLVDSRQDLAAAVANNDALKPTQ